MRPRGDVLLLLLGLSTGAAVSLELWDQEQVLNKDLNE